MPTPVLKPGYGTTRRESSNPPALSTLRYHAPYHPTLSLGHVRYYSIASHTTHPSALCPTGF
eukprot:2202962-Rhodomonas_salina.1